MRRELDDIYLRALKPPPSGRIEIWDTRIPGLVFRITPSGVASWSVRSRTSDGKRTRPTLGTYPALGLSQARKQALATLAAIQGGGDPAGQKRAARAKRLAQAALPTVGDCLAEWQAARAENWSDRYASEVRRIVDREIVPKLGKSALAETARADWAGLAAAKRKTAPAVATLLYRVCSAFLGHAEAHGWTDTAMLPRKGLATIAPPPASRARALTDAELRAIWDASEALPPKARAFARLLILTAARESEVADIACGEVDLDAARWSVPRARTKNGQGITLPLCAAALAELGAVWPAHGDLAGPAWRLLGGIKGSGIRGFSKIKAKLDNE